ncbi:unnamed protein product [Vicia faba]|uniref:Uncharacterized protein n=1 Tax=Vicia faba TaxID=3906 RepID=A0AAV1B2H2_VICFA|nr:unnamed protein product [Vicia faba]
MDVEKLSKDLNNVYFGDYGLFANVAHYDRFENFDSRNLGEGDGEKILIHEIRKYSRENGRREAEFGFSRKKKLERVKEDEIMSEKENFRVVTDEGVVNLNGVSVPVIQQFISDVGFHDFMVALLGGDKIFMYFTGKSEVMSVFNKLADFFRSFVCDCRAWSKDNDLVYERGVWARCYGISLHAGNVRLDYGHILTTTKLLREINEVEDFWADGMKYPIKFVEDIKFGLADDTCLVEYEEENESQGTELGCEFEDAL